MHIERAEDDLLRLATAVIDNEAVDWKREESDDEGRRRRVDNLRLIQSIGNAHREVREDLVGTQTLEGLRPTSWGKLERLHWLDSGAFGDVYRAWDPNLQCEVALKLPSAGAMAGSDPNGRFLHEARQLAKVHHENVLRVLGADTHSGRVGIWTELIEGRTLEELIEHSGPFSAGEATSIGVDLCRALSAVHGSGVVHCDVKTANVKREAGGRIVLLDFSTAENRPRTNDGQSGLAPLAGTLRYMAPEQFCGQPASVQSDVYALGVVLYRLVTGAYPNNAKTLEELAANHERGVITPLLEQRPDLDAGFAQVIERALSKDLRERFASAGEMRMALENRELPHDRIPEPEPYPRWLFLAASVLLVAIAVGAFSVRKIFVEPLVVEAKFYSVVDDQPTRALSPMSTVTFDDEVFLELTVSRTAHVYVLNLDERGSLLTMFPLQPNELSNPLEANRLYQLPDSQTGWGLSIAGEVETVFVIASEQPLEEVEEIIAAIPAASEEPVAIEPETILRGFGRVRTRTNATTQRQSDVSRLSKELKELAESRSGLWVETYFFRSPVEKQIAE